MLAGNFRLKQSDLRLNRQNQHSRSLKRRNRDVSNIIETAV